RPHDVIGVMAMPPTLIVPLWVVVAENSVFFALPVLTSLNVFALLELHWGCLCGVRLFCNVEVLRLKWLACRCGRSRYFSTFRCLSCLSFISSHWGLAFLALLTVISFYRGLGLLAF